MKLILISTIVTLAAIQSVQADVMAPGQIASRIEYSEGKSKTVFDGNGNEVDYKAIGALGGIDKRDTKNVALSHSIGIGHKAQIDLGLNYSHADATVASQGGIAEVSARYLYGAYSNDSFDINIGFGVRAPGDNKGGSAFTSLSDGLTKYDYNLDLGYIVSPLLKAGLNIRFTDRNSSISKSQTLMELYGTYFPNSNFYLNASYLMFNTSGGTDVLAAGFDFSTLKEKYNAFNLTVGYKINNQYGIDAHYGQKLTSNAANTDGNTTIGLGLNCSY